MSDDSREDIRNATSVLQVIKVVAKELVLIREILEEDLKLKQIRHGLSQRRERFC